MNKWKNERIKVLALKIDHFLSVIWVPQGQLWATAKRQSHSPDVYYYTCFCLSQSSLRIWQLVWVPKPSRAYLAGLELRSRDSINAMHFSFFTIQVFSTYPENYDTKESFCFLNRGAKAKFFLADKAKNNSNMTRISFLLKQLCCCLSWNKILFL